jgi:glycosyltransferase involved in cell wall biosynthesis
VGKALAGLDALDGADTRLQREGVGAAAPDRLSAIIPLLGDRTDVGDVYQAYRDAVSSIGLPYELIYVISEQASTALADLTALRAGDERVKIVIFARWPGEAEALSSGLRHAGGDIILMLPADRQVDPADLPRVVAEIDQYDMAVGRRLPQTRGSIGARVQTAAFHWMLRSLFGHAFNDLICRVRACRREVLNELVDYGLQPHFLPLVAAERGFRVREIRVRAGSAEPPPVGAHLGGFERLRIMLDILALYMMLKFAKKPLRFFGSLGVPVLLVGLAYTGWLVFARLFLGAGLAERPALILGVLLIVLGIQIIALGLIGEIIIFVSGKTIKDYSIEKKIV